MYQRNLHQNQNNNNMNNINNNNNNNNRGGAAGEHGAGAGYNDEQYDSSESDTDSDAEMEENPVGAEEEARAANALADANNILLAGAAENIGAVAEDLAAAINDLDDLEDPRPAHNGILERIDYIQGRRRDNDLLRGVGGEERDGGENLNAGESRPIGFDENSRENFGLGAMLDDDSACAEAMRMVAPINDDSSRESMDIDSDNETSGVVELGNINIAAIPLPGEREPDEAVGGVAGPSRFFGDTVGPYDNFMRIEKCPNPQMISGPSGSRQCQQEAASFNGALNPCCSSSSSSSSSSLAGPISGNTSNNMHTINTNPNISRISASSSKETSTSHVEHTCQKLMLPIDDAPSTSFPATPKQPATNSSATSHIRNSAATHCDSNKRPRCSADLDSSDDDEVEIVKPKVLVTDSSTCDCHLVIQLDHVNGHSSKMSEEAATRKPCEKCRQANDNSEKVATVEGDEAQLKGNEEEIAQPVVVEEAEREEEEVAEPVAQPANVRPRDAANDPEAARPNKKLKLNHGGAANRIKTPRTIFHRALDAVGMTWDNQHLKLILASNAYTASPHSPSPFLGASTSKAVHPSTTVVSGSNKAAFNAMGQPLWHEPLAMCAARVDSLRSHGHNEAALRLSVSVVRTMKQVQMDAQLLWHRYQRFLASQASPPEEKPSVAKRCCCSCTQMPSMVPLKSGPSSSSAARPPLPHDPPAGSSSKSYKMSRYDYDAPPTSSSRYNPMASSCRRCAEARNADRSLDYAQRPHMYPPVPTFHPNRFHQQTHPFAMRPQYAQSFDARFSQQRYGYNNGGAGNHNHHHHNQQPQHQPPLQMPLGPYGGNCTAPNCGTPSRPHLVSGCGGAPLDGVPRISRCEECRPKDDDMPQQQDAHLAGPSTAKDQPPPPPPPPHSFASSNLAAMIHSAPVEPHKHADKTHCAQHSKNQCCIKYFCCKMPTNKDNQQQALPPRCCPAAPPPLPPTHHHSAGHHQHHHHNHSQQPHNNQHHMQHFSNPTQCHIKSYERMPNNFQMYDPLVKREHCPCLVANGSAKASVSKAQNTVNFGASTSKSTSNSTHNPSTSSQSNSVSSSLSLPAEFTRNRKPACVSNCLDCTVGCEVDFPLDAVACIFDCLTEACSVPPEVMMVNEPGRLPYENQAQTLGEDAGGTPGQQPPRYHHVAVPMSNDRNETYLTLAFDVRISLI